MFDGLASNLSAIGRRLSPTPNLAETARVETAPGGSPVTTTIRSSGLSPRSVIVQAALLWLATRVAFAIFTYVAIPLASQSVHGQIELTVYPPHVLLAGWNRWDTQWYTRIGTDGYNNVLTTGFFPFYPLLIHIVTIVVGAANAVAAALFISNLAALAAFIAVGLLAAQEYGSDVAPPAIRVFAAFPLAFFLAGGYSDSVFIALAAFSLLFARRGMWPWAAACAFLATFTRLFGVVLILPLLWEYGRQTHPLTPIAERGYPLGVRLRLLPNAILLGGAVPLALVIWGTYQWIRFGDALSYLHVQQKHWDHYAVPPWQWFQTAWDRWQHVPHWTYVEMRILFDLAPVLIILILTLIAIRHLPVSFTLYMIGTLLICFTSSVPRNFDPFTGQGRYMLMSVPIFLLLGKWTARRPGLDLFIVGGGFMLQGLFTEIFLRGGWLV